MKKIIIIAFLFVISSIIYSNSLYNNFVDIDDNSLIVDNPYISDLSLKGIKQLLVPHRDEIYGYLPVAYLFDMACFAFSGKFDPLPFRITSIFFNSLAVILCYLVISLVSNSERVAFWSAFLFALHPSHTEAVNWIAGNFHLFAAVFSLLTVYFYIKNINSRVFIFYILSLISFIFANMSKPSVVLLPFLLLIYECWIRERRIKLTDFSLNNPLYSAIPFFFISGLFIICNNFLFPPATSYALITNVFGWRTLFKFPAFFNQYLINVFLPLRNDIAGMCYLPRYFDPFYFSMLVLFALFLFFCYYLKVTKQKLVLFGIVWFVIFLLPSISMIEIPTPFSLRLLYLPSVGMYMSFILIAQKGYALFSRNRYVKFAAIIFWTLILIGFGAITMNKNTHWYSSRTLWGSMLNHYPERFLGSFRLERFEGDVNKRIKNEEKLLGDAELCSYGYPDLYQRMKHTAYVILGNLYISRNMDENKIKNLFYQWRDFEPQNAYPPWQLGTYYERRGLLKEAQSEYEKAVKIADSNYDFWLSLARIYEKQGLEDKAKAAFDEIKKRWPQSSDK